MTSELAARMRLVDPSPTLAVTAKAKAMRAKGLDVIGFGAGEPDFDTPDHIKAAAKAAIDAGETKYTPNAGSPALKKAILAGIARDYGLEGCYAPDQVIVSAGAKQSLYNLMYALVGERDAVLIPVPAWVSYPAQVKMIGATPIEIPTDSAEGFRLDPEAVREAARSAKARGLHPKVLILNSPSNPTGAMYARADLERIAEIALEEGMWIVSDDMYMKIAYGETPFFSVATISPEVRARTIIVNGVSKAYAMTGWRIGYAVGDKAVLAATDDIQSQVTSNACSISQAAAAAAIAGPQECVAPMVAEFKRRRDTIVDRLNAIDGVTCNLPAGAFYVFPDVSALFGRRAGERKLGAAADIADYLLESVQVAVVPGEGFGDARFIRLSYATSMDDIRNGLDRIAKAFAALT